MYYSPCHCGWCGHIVPSAQNKIIDVWPGGVRGVLLRTKVACRSVDWPLIMRQTGWALAKGVGFSSAFVIMLGVLLEATG